MSLLIKETVGDTITDVINGINKSFTTSFIFIPTSVGVYLNGQLKVGSLDDGFIITGAQTIEMKIAPMVGDTLVLEYLANIITGGGAIGGTPPPAEMEVLIPCITSIETTVVECLTP